MTLPSAASGEWAWARSAWRSVRRSSCVVLKLFTLPSAATSFLKKLCLGPFSLERAHGPLACGLPP